MVKIWRNRVEAGTQKLANCPSRYRAGVVGMIQNDLTEGTITANDLAALVAAGMMTAAEYEELTGEPYDE